MQRRERENAGAKRKDVKVEPREEGFSYSYTAASGLFSWTGLIDFNTKYN